MGAGSETVLRPPPNSAAAVKVVAPFKRLAVIVLHYSLILLQKYYMNYSGYLYIPYQVKTFDFKGKSLIDTIFVANGTNESFGRRSQGQRDVFHGAFRDFCSSPIGQSNHGRHTRTLLNFLCRYHFHTMNARNLNVDN